MARCGRTCCGPPFVARVGIAQPYDYIEVSKASPETLSVWRRGRIVTRRRAITGIAARPTADGTFPVYARYLLDDDERHKPRRQPYSDPGVPYVAYFNGGDAVHGFLRGGYGYPQSLGCVELPYQRRLGGVHFTIPIGTLVGVS